MCVEQLVEEYGYSIEDADYYCYIAYQRCMNGD